MGITEASLIWRGDPNTPYQRSCYFSVDFNLAPIIDAVNYAGKAESWSFQHSILLRFLVKPKSHILPEIIAFHVDIPTRIGRSPFQELKIVRSACPPL